MNLAKGLNALDAFGAHGARAGLLIALLALLARALVVFWLGNETVWLDGHRYLKVAGNLLEGRGFGGILDNRLSVPALALVIAGVKGVFGDSLLVLRLFFALLGSASCVMGYFLARRLFGPSAGLLAGLLLAIYPYHVYLSALFEYPQTLFIFLMAAVFLLLFRFVETGRLVVLFTASLLLGAAILTVPTALLFVPPFVLYLGWGSIRRFITVGFVVAAALLLTVGSWTTRNYVAYGQFILVNKAVGQNFWSANNATYYEHGKQAVVPACAPGFEATSFCREFIDDAVRIGNAGMSDIDIVSAHEAVGWERGIKYIRDNPWHFAQLGVSKFLHFWSPVPDAVQDGEATGGSARDWIAIASYTPVLLLGLIGAARSWHRRRELLPMYLYFIAMTAPYCVFLPVTRYRLPLDFFLIIFAALAFDLWLRRRVGAPAPARGA